MPCLWHPSACCARKGTCKTQTRCRSESQAASTFSSTSTSTHLADVGQQALSQVQVHLISIRGRLVGAERQRRVGQLLSRQRLKGEGQWGRQASAALRALHAGAWLLAALPAGSPRLATCPHGSVGKPPLAYCTTTKTGGCLGMANNQMAPPDPHTRPGPPAQQSGRTFPPGHAPSCPPPGSRWRGRPGRVGREGGRAGLLEGAVGADGGEARPATHQLGGASLLHCNGPWCIAGARTPLDSRVDTTSSRPCTAAAMSGVAPLAAGAGRQPAMRLRAGCASPAAARAEQSAACTRLPKSLPKLAQGIMPTPPTVLP